MDEDDEQEGILVRRTPTGPWEAPTQREVQEVMQHDAELREEREQQEKEDVEAFQRFRASQLQDWEDWALANEMNSQAGPAMKRVRVVMVLGSQGGGTVAEGVMEGAMEANAHPMVTMTMSEVPLTQTNDQQIKGPPTPDTIPVPEAEQARGPLADEHIDLDRFLQTEHGRRWFQNWLEGQVDDTMVKARWGANVLELFAVTKALQEDHRALATQTLGGATGQDMDRNEYGVNRTTGLEGDKDKEAEEKKDREQADAETNVMDTEDKLDDDDTALMQKVVHGDYETALQNLLKELEVLTKAKAARLSYFLQQLLVDQRRMAPHLRNPTLADRHDRLLALLVVFEDAAPALRGDETAWCMERWQGLQPFLENARLPEGVRREDRPRPSDADQNVVEVVDSQEQVEDGGSRKQVAQLGNGTQRELTEQEQQEILENELMEELAAEDLRNEEKLLWKEFHAAELREWETWAVSTAEGMQSSRKRARVQVVVQGQGGRIIKNENWLLSLGPGERLSYSVSVIPDATEEIEDASDPTAASSGPAGDTGTQAGGSVGAGQPEGAATLPVTGESPVDMWDETDLSVAKDLDVEDFMLSEIAARFYQYWKDGVVTDRLVGQRFGYGVLGRFYSNRLWEQGCFDGMEEDSGQIAAPPRPENAEDDSFQATQVDQEGASADGAEHGDERHEETGSVEEGEPASTAVGTPEQAGHLEGHPAASTASTTEGSAAVSSRPSEGTDRTGSGVLTGSRQTSLAHWLL